MPKAIEVAMELRKLADALEQGGEVKIKRPIVGFHHHGAEDKELFMALARIFPRPYRKEFGERGIELKHEPSSALYVFVSAPRSVACRIVTPAQPAVYDCEPLLSEAEEAEVA